MYTFLLNATDAPGASELTDMGCGLSHAPSAPGMEKCTETESRGTVPEFVRFTLTFWIVPDTSTSGATFMERGDWQTVVEKVMFLVSESE